MHSPVNLRHARLLNFLHVLSSMYVEAHQLGELHREVVAVRLSSRNVFLPDLAFFTNEQVPRLLDTHAPFAPAFVLEALSPRTSDRDLGPKFAAYEEHGVNEYWVIDPDHAQHQFYRREGELLVEFARTGEKIKSSVIRGFWVKRSWLNPANLPSVQTCLAELLR